MSSGRFSVRRSTKDAKEFYDREARSGNVPLMLEILVPKGTPCMFVGQNTSYSAYQGELILGRGLKYRVLEKTDKKLVLEVAE